MQRTDEYHRHAVDCRNLADKMPTREVRDQLLEMAAIWERMAEERTQFVADNTQFEVRRSDD